MNNFTTLPAIILTIIAGFYLLFGIMFMIDPVKFSSGLGFINPGTAAIVEIRAVYGGLELALAFGILYKIYIGQGEAAGFIALLSFIGFGGGRLIAGIISGFVGLHLYFLIFEVILGLMSLYAFITFQNIKNPL